MVFWAGNFIVVKGAIGDPAAGRLHVPALLRRGGHAAGPAALARGSDPAPARGHHPDLRLSASSASAATRCSGRSRCRRSRPATRRCSSPRRRSSPRSSRWRSGRTRRTPVKLVGALVSFAGVALVIAAGRGRRPRRLARRRRADAHRGGLLGRLHGLRRAGPATPLAAGDDDLGDRRRDAVHRAARHRPAGDDPTCRRSARRSSRDPLLRDARGRRRQRRRVPRREAARARPGSTALQFLVPPSRSSWPRSSSTSRSGPTRWSAGRSSWPASRCSRGSWPGRRRSAACDRRATGAGDRRRHGVGATRPAAAPRGAAAGDPRRLRRHGRAHRRLRHDHGRAHARRPGRPRSPPTTRAAWARAS